MNMLALAAAAALPAPMEIPSVLSAVPKCTTNTDAGEIVVCGKASEQRLKPLSSGPIDQPAPRAEAQIANGIKAGLTAESATLANGVISNRAMVHVKIAF
jgi:hypothetical protein